MALAIKLLEARAHVAKPLRIQALIAKSQGTLIILTTSQDLAYQNHVETNLHSYLATINQSHQRHSTSLSHFLQGLKGQSHLPSQHLGLNPLPLQSRAHHRP